MTLPEAGLTKSYDWLIPFLIFVLLVEPSAFFNRKLWKAFRYINLFFVLLVVLIFYSVYVQKVELSVSLRVFRNYSFVILIYIFCRLNRAYIEKVLRLIVYFTGVASVVYCLQLVVGTSLLNNLLDDYSTIDIQINNGLARYYNIPVLVTPVFFFLLADKTIVAPKLRLVLGFAALAAIILSQHRNLLLAIIACSLVYYIIQHKVGIFKVAMVLGIASLVLTGVNSITDNRFSEGFGDLENMLNNGITRNDIVMADMNLLSTSEFRFYHFYERVSYVLEQPVRSVLGIGLLSEDSYVVKDLHFNIGLPNDMNDVTQVDTGDIVWSLLVMHLGILGTILFIVMYGNILSRFYRSRADPKMMTGFLFVLNLLFISFYGMVIIIPPVTCMVMLFVVYQYKLQTERN
jgi:hypothetical protein